MKTPQILAAALVAIALAACSRADARNARATQPATAPMEAPAMPAPTIAQQLSAFRQGLAQPAGLADGYASVDALEQAFTRALAAGDTAALRRMAMDRAEFAWFYYPANRRSLPPYELDPDLMWMQLEQGGARGVRRSVREYGHQPVRLLEHGCLGPNEAYGSVRVMNGCWIRHSENGRATREMLHGGIIEHAGRYKLVSLANKL